MAMTTCPNCGEQISDKAKKCVHCGTVLVPEEKKYCSDCGAELEEGMDICPKCGCPIENIIETEKTPQQVEVTGVKITKKSKKIIVIATIAVLAAAIITAIGVQTHKKNVAAKAVAEAQKQSEEYGTNLNMAAYSMLSGASDAETCGNLIKQVWYNAIYKESDSTTNKYTKPDGYFVSDFNDALQNLFSDSSFSGQIADINSNNKRPLSNKENSLKNNITKGQTIKSIGLAAFVEKKEFCPDCKSHMILAKNQRGTAYLRCSNKNCKKMKYLTADLLNWYISNHNVACPKNDGGDLKGILGKYGPCVRCSRGHFLKPEEI